MVRKGIREKQDGPGRRAKIKRLGEGWGKVAAGKNPQRRGPYSLLGLWGDQGRGREIPKCQGAGS